MRNLLEAKGFNLGSSQSPIIPIFIEDHKKLQMVVRELFQEGIYSTPICFPAVKVNEGRIRLILNSAHTREHIETTVDALERICKKHFVIGSQEDPLTGLHVRRVLDEKIESAFILAVRSNKSIAVSMVAVDHLTEINERFSHRIGDRVLREIAIMFKSSTRGTDILCRYSDDEFALLFMNTTASDIRVLCERMSKKVEGYDWQQIATGLQVTISIGLSDVSSSNTAIALIDKALENLAKAKQGGGNQVFVD